jgi:uncharacterized protein with FMN-binding domain
MTRSLSTKYTLGALAGISLLGTLAGCSSAATGSGTADDTTTGTDSSSESSTDTGAGTDSATDAGTETAAGTYTDGTYTAEGEYKSPNGTETVSVEITLEGDAVSAVTVTPEATNPNSVRYQTEFAEGISDEIVGQNIDDLEVDRVAGSSLTSGGFNEAVESIKADAAA